MNNKLSHYISNKYSYLKFTDFKYNSKEGLSKLNPDQPIINKFITCYSPVTQRRYRIDCRHKPLEDNINNVSFGLLQYASKKGISGELVLKIKNNCEGKSQREISEEFQIGKGTVHRIFHNQYDHLINEHIFFNFLHNIFKELKYNSNNHKWRLQLIIWIKLYEFNLIKKNDKKISNNKELFSNCKNSVAYYLKIKPRNISNKLLHLNLNEDEFFSEVNRVFIYKQDSLERSILKHLFYNKKTTYNSITELNTLKDKLINVKI